MTPQQLAAATGATIPVATSWLQPIVAACTRFQINTPRRQAAFLSQIGVESGGLVRLLENLNYSEEALLEMWPDRFDTHSAAIYGRTVGHPANPVAIANIAYAGRYGNGDVQSGDGARFIGRGLIQLTFRDNYRAGGAAVGLPLESNPDLAAMHNGAALIAGWFWQSHGCNALADAGDFVGITRAINGGLNGLTDRQRLYALAQEALHA